MKISKEIKVGVVAIFAIAILFWGFNYLKGTNLFVKSSSVYAVYPKVPGLSVSAPIIINGVQSGIVDAIYFHPDKSSRVVVRLNITEDKLMIPKNSRADLISLDFLGSKAIGLKLGDSPKPIEPGDTLTSYFEKSMIDDVSEQILPIKEKAENLMLSLDTAVVGLNHTLDNLNDMFSEKNKRNLTNALASLKTTIESFDALANNMNSTINTSVKPTMKTYKNLGDSLAALDLTNTLKKAQTTLDNLSTTLNKVNNGEGTMGLLMNDSTLYNNLDSVTKDMDRLMIDMRENPKRYVHFSIFGRKDKKKKNN